ncbi:MAG: hypothetical protein U0637_14820 [Phycisphaerales bacterium]
MTNGQDNFGAMDGDVPVHPFMDDGAAHVDALLACAAEEDRRGATRERLDRIIAATTPSLEGCVPSITARTWRIPQPAAARPRSWGAVRLAAGLALMLSVGAAIIAGRQGGRPVAAESALASRIDATTNLDMLDTLFASSGVGETWTDAEALHTRVSADMDSYWGTDDLFGAGEASDGESL